MRFFFLCALSLASALTLHKRTLDYSDSLAASDSNSLDSEIYYKHSGLLQLTIPTSPRQWSALEDNLLLSTPQDGPAAFIARFEALSIELGLPVKIIAERYKHLLKRAMYKYKRRRSGSEDGEVSSPERDESDSGSPKRKRVKLLETPSPVRGFSNEGCVFRGTCDMAGLEGVRAALFDSKKASEQAWKVQRSDIAAMQRRNAIKLDKQKFTTRLEAETNSEGEVEDVSIDEAHYNLLYSLVMDPIPV